MLLASLAKPPLPDEPTARMTATKMVAAQLICQTTSGTQIMLSVVLLPRGLIATPIAWIAERRGRP